MFEEYMMIQELFKGNEWDLFMTYLRSPLPVTFRVNRSLHDPKVVKSCLDEFQPLLSPDDPSQVSTPPPYRSPSHRLQLTPFATPAGGGGAVVARPAARGLV